MSNPYHIIYDNLPVGRTLEANKGVGKVRVRTNQFFSTEDGQLLVDALEGFPQDILNLVKQQCNKELLPSAVYQLLTIISRDKKAIVYVNEPQITYTARVTGPISKGQRVVNDDISQIFDVSFSDVSVPQDCGVLFLFSLGWRRGLFYDFGPICMANGQPSGRAFDLGQLLGKLFTRVVFQNRFGLTEKDWQAFFEQGMFPFIGLRDSFFKKLLSHSRSGWDLRELSVELLAEVDGRLDEHIRKWEEHPAFAPHIDFLRTAIGRYKEGDFLSCISLVVPRIEGILRSQNVHLGRTSFSQRELAETPITAQQEESNILLPARFKSYLKEVFFAGFDPEIPPCDSKHILSRNTATHGMAEVGVYDSYNASVCFLVLHHIYLCLEDTTLEESSGVVEHCP